MNATSNLCVCAYVHAHTLRNKVFLFFNTLIRRLFWMYYTQINFSFIKKKIRKAVLKVHPTIFTEKENIPWFYFGRGVHTIWHIVRVLRSPRIKKGRKEERERQSSPLFNQVFPKYDLFFFKSHENICVLGITFLAYLCFCVCRRNSYT